MAKQSAAQSDAKVRLKRVNFDVPPELHGRLKILAVRRGQTMSDMLREMVQREFSTPRKSGAHTS